MDEIGRFYQAEDRAVGTHLALRWNGRVRFTVPREKAAQQACWRNFRPGRLGLPLRAMARLPWLFGAISCGEAANLIEIRELLGSGAGLSCCRTGAEGVWSKDTILFLDGKAEPLYIVKAGAGKAVDALLENEANWLQRLRNQSTLADRIPEFVAHRAGTDLCFVAQHTLSGNLDFRLGDAQIEFLRRLQKYSLRSKLYEDSVLCRTLDSRLKDLHGLLPDAWSIRLDGAVRHIKESLSRSPVILVAAHNDFTPWNIRVQHNIASAFDWEYAADEQFPLFDPLHYALMPMALKREPPARIMLTMNRTVQLCRDQFGEDRCYQAETQSLAYFVNLCTLYLWADRGSRMQNPVVVRYAHIIDSICRR